MKRRTNSLFIALVLVMLTSCNSNNDINTVKNGTYVLEVEGTEAVVSPSVTISNKDITFSYDMLSSYLPVGVYTIEDDVLTMRTNDGKYKYVFQLDGESLVFQEDESSEVKLIDERFGSKITNEAEFKLIEE